MRLGRGARGYTLIEMLAAIMVFTIVLSLAVALLALLMRLDDGARRHTDVLMTTERLGRQLRADVRGAERAAIEGDRLTLERGDGGRVVYEVNPRWVRRALIQDGAETATERYRMHRPGARLELEKRGESTRVVLEFDHRATAAGSARLMRLEGTLGADRRLTERGAP